MDRLDTMGRNVMAAVSQHYLSKRGGTALRGYLLACEATATSPYPITQDKALGWLHYRCSHQGLSSGDLADRYAQLRTAWKHTSGFDFEDDARQRRATISALRTAYPKPASKVPLPVSAKQLWTLYGHICTRRYDMHALGLYSGLALGYASGLRISELMQDNLRCCDVEVIDEGSTKGVVISKLLSKTSKHTLDRQLVCFNIARDDPPLLAPLAEWCNWRKVGLGPTGSNDNLFTIVKKGEDSRRPYYPALWIQHIHQLYRDAGLDPRGISGKSMRIGRRTNLANNGVDLTLVKTAVGWQSNASERYDGRTPREVIRQLAKSRMS